MGHVVHEPFGVLAQLGKSLVPPLELGMGLSEGLLSGGFPVIVLQSFGAVLHGLQQFTRIHGLLKISLCPLMEGLHGRFRVRVGRHHNAEHVGLYLLQLGHHVQPAFGTQTDINQCNLGLKTLGDLAGVLRGQYDGARIPV